MQRCAVRALFVCALPVVFAQTPGGDWPTYNRDLAGTRYSPLTQINTKNVGKLAQAWTIRVKATNLEATPLVVAGVMYLPMGNNILALDPETGREIWRHEEKMPGVSQRGVTYWPGDR